MTGRPARGDIALALYPLTLLALTLALTLARPRVGPLALALVFAPYLFLPLLALAPAALRGGRPLLRMALAAAAAVFLIISPPAINLAAEPAASPTPAVRALSWNMYVGGASVSQLRAVVEARAPDIVALQEVDWEAIAADQALMARYPYRLLNPAESAPGMALLSRHPIVAADVPELSGAEWDMPRLVWARVDVAGRPLLVINAHPIPPRTFDGPCPLLRCYNRGPRDAQIAAFGALTRELRESGEPLLLLGDMNVTEREEAYLDLSAGLSDAHRAVGLGFGLSWRPGFTRLPSGMLRIDYMFSANGLTPLALDTDCTWRGSDHCLLVGEFALG
jgi:endonuclease/exonuclease/phosphatase (EEP) superfamily protein YafD